MFVTQARTNVFKDEQIKGDAMRFILGVAVVLVLVTGCQPAEDKSAPAAGSNAAPAQTPVERGKYLTRVGGCNDCHTPKTFGPNGPEADMTKELSGHPAGDKIPPVTAKFGEGGFGTLTNGHLTAWIGPWGISYAMNLTPDKGSGLGSWTEQMFIDAIRNGKHQGTGRPILPPMPWNWYRDMTDEDLKAVFAYLQSLPPISNQIPDPTAFDKIPK
jgi:mono/diheme cytochrome c family protein